MGISKFVAWKASSLRILLIVSPFLAIVVVLVSIAVASFNILSVGRAYVEGESLWSKNQKQAVFHLILFAKSGNAADFARYREAMKVPLGFRKARLELIKPMPNEATVMEGLIEGGTHPDDVAGVLKLFQRFRNVSYMENVLDTWESGDKYIAELDVAARRLQKLWSAGDPDAFAINALLNRIVRINEALIPLMNQFSNTLREAVRWIQTILYLVILTVAGTLIPIGISLTLRIVRRVDRAEEEVKALRLGQIYAEKLAFQASHDGLTGLVNRPEFESRLVRAIQNAPVAGRQHAVMFLDLDQFKIVNDTCGHAAGDQLLRQVSSLLKKNLRATDTLSRLGGDEFGVLLENCAVDDVLRIAEQLRQSVADFRFMGEDRTFTIGISIGVVLIEDGMLNRAEIMSAADATCYMAKDKGRNRVQVYQPHDNEISQRRGEMEWFSRLQRALEEDRFVLYSQEIRSVKAFNAKCRHKELLIRMVDELGQLVPPMAFIPAAERYGLMPLIDQWVVKNALSTISRTHADHGTIAINVSGTSIGDERFLEFVREQFQKFSVPPRSVCFELTETAAIANFDKASRFFAEMKSLGCLFSLDDFGAGMSSFGYLRHLPVDYIKIDGSFVKEVAKNPVDRAMVRAIHDVGHVMGKKTIGEFVDGEAGLAALREIGVNFAQGHWVSPPKLFPLLPADNEMAVESATDPSLRVTSGRESSKAAPVLSLVSTNRRISN